MSTQEETRNSMPPEEALPPEMRLPAAAEVIRSAVPEGAHPDAQSLSAPSPDAPSPHAPSPDAASPEAQHPEDADAAPGRARRLAPLGLIAFVLAALLAVAEGVAIYLASSGQPLAATVIGQVLVVLTAVPLALGLYAVVRGRNRDWGIAAMVVAVVANPLILMNILDFFGTI